MISLLSNCRAPWLLGFTGPAGAGKDTAAAYLEDQYAFEPIALADPIRDMVAALFEHVDVDAACCSDRTLKELPVPVLDLSYRQLAQTLGTEWGRCVKPDLWLLVAEHRMRQAFAQGMNVVVTDIRFPNEARWLQQQGGKLVRLMRDDVPAVHQHTSEGYHATFEPWHTISNHGSPAHLRDQLDVMFDRLCKDGAP